MSVAGSSGPAGMTSPEIIKLKAQTNALRAIKNTLIKLKTSLDEFCPMSALLQKGNTREFIDCNEFAHFATTS
jgi:hypothetical protein